MKKEKRIDYIDIAKGIGIILVVIGHCINGHSIAGRYISSFHMPLFFFISVIAVIGTSSVILLSNSFTFSKLYLLI